MNDLISVCMPYRNRINILNRCIGALREHYDGLEISICDDGSPVPLDLHLSADLSDGCTIRLDQQPERDYALNPCVPINIAINQSRGDFICLQNPETIHIAPILGRMVHAIKDRLDYVIAAVKDEHTGRWLSRSDYMGESWMPIPPGAGFHFCALFTRELWEKAGGFDEAYRYGQGCDDNDWCWRLYAAGARFKYLDDCVALNAKTPKVEWPKGGAKRNQALLRERWGSLMNQIGVPAA